MRRILGFRTAEVRSAEITEDQIARRAFEILEAGGRPDDCADANWQTAEAELLAESAPRRQRPLRRLIRRIRGQAASF